MSLIRWSPFFEPFDSMEKMMDEMNVLVPRMSQQGNIVPPVDIYETDKNVVVETPMPGIDPSKIEISIENGVLSIKANSERKTEVDEKNYYRKEVRQGSMFRQVALPARVEEKSAEASFENGILKIALPKKEEQKMIKVEVKKK
jgi:HSP20 family protein